MRDFYSIGATPADEPCMQLGPNYNDLVARLECVCYRRAMINVYGPPPGEAAFGIKSNPYENGSYLELVIYFDPNNEKEAEYALKVEEGLEKWPQEILENLKKQVQYATGTPYEQYV